MKKIKLYQILSLGMMGICVVGLCLVGVRIFAKKVLIAKFGMNNYAVCYLADFNWGDRLEQMPVDKADMVESERLVELENILADAPVEEKKETVTEESDPLTDFKAKVLSAEDDFTKYCNNKFLLYSNLKSLGLQYDRMLNWDLAYARTAGTTYTLKTGFDYEAVEEKDMADYTKKLLDKRQVAEAAGVDFLYVQYPYRVDEVNSQVPWGATSYENQNTDAVLSALNDASVDYLDLRDALVEQGWNNNTGFYDTDGHWTTRSGFMSAGIVADYLNENYEFNYDEKYFDEASYEVKSYSVNNPSVKEQVELFLPTFDTNLNVTDAYRQEAYTGTFADSCFDMTKADTTEYSTALTAYSASRIRNSYLFEYQNLQETNNNKRILVCSNSFSWHLIPYLALDTEYVDYVYNITTEQLEYYINELSPDMVIIMDRP